MSREPRDDAQDRSEGRRLLLRLFVAGEGPNSREAVANLEAIRQRCLRPDDVKVEIVDVLEDPLRALEDGVLVTPTLKAYNSPPVSIVGTLRDHQRVMQALGLPHEDAWSGDARS